MIEVINHGNTYKRIVCEECRCEFLFADNDTYLSMSGGVSQFYVKCPECGYPNNRLKALKGGAE